MVSWPEPLIRELADRRVVLFVGSGVSKAAYNALPTWGELLNDLSQFASTKKNRDLTRKLVKSNRLLDAAELVGSFISRAELRQKLKEIFVITPMINSEIFSDLLSLDSKNTVTTNYDQMIEKNFEHYSGGEIVHEVRKHGYDNILSDLRSPTRVILKIHGCITEPENIVLDRRSYFNAKRKNPGIFDVVKSLATINTVLFLGYSVSDPDIQYILEEINSRSSSDNPHYALVSKFEHASIRDAIGNTHNVRFIEYPSGAHEEFPRAVSELAIAVQEKRRSLGLPM